MSSLPTSETPDSNRTDRCGVNIAQERGQAVLPERKTRRWILFGGCALILAGVIFWRPIQQRFLAYFLLRSEAPSEEVLSGAVEQTSDPIALLTKLWRTQRIPNREFVLNYLGRISTAKPDLFRTMESVVFEATQDADIATRESAFAALARTKHPELRRLALAQLYDADPAARLIGLQSLRNVATSNDVPVAMRMLADPEPRVVVAAALVLRKVTGQDFGIKSTLALPQFTCIDTNPPPAPDLEAIAQGVRRWHEWFAGHQVEYAPVSAFLSVAHQAVPLATADFTLEDPAGKRIQLSRFRGKSVLLVFWSLGAPASLNDADALSTLQQSKSQRLAVLGICVPDAPSCADEHEHGHDHAHHHDHCAAGRSPQQMRAQVKQTSDRLKTTFPMLVDPQRAVGSRFGIQDLPGYVLIDDQGMVRRRFDGFRTKTALGDMMEELIGSRTSASKVAATATKD